MGDRRFADPPSPSLLAQDRAQALSATSDEGIIEQLAAASRSRDAANAGALAAEALDRMRRARTAMANLAEGVISCDASGRVTHANRAAEALLGREEKEMIGEDIAALIRARDGAGQRLGREVYPTLVAIRTRSVVQRDDLSYETRDGGNIQVDLIAAPVVVDDAVEGAVVAFRDVSARKVAEAALRRRAEQHAIVAELGLEALRGASLQRLFDTAVAALLRALPVEFTKVLQLDPGGATLTLRAGEGWDAGIRPHHAQVSAGLGSQAGYTLVTKGPVIVEHLASDHRFNGPPLLTHHGVVSGMSVVIEGIEGPWGVLGVHSGVPRDFTKDDIHFLQSVANALAYAIQRTESEGIMQRRIEERTRSLAEVNRDLQTFMNSASHDLRAPIRGVDALLSALIEDHGSDMDASSRELVERALRENRRASRLIHDLLAFARSAQSPVDPERVDLTALARTVAAQVDAEDPARRTSWVIEEDMNVHADPRLLRIALHDLFDNAAKYSGRVPQPRVEVSLTEAPETARIRVRDNGVGFSMADAPRLFEPFQRLPTAAGFEGTGLGLATAMRIAVRHGGTIRVRSDPGEGATFELELPREEPRARGSRASDRQG